MDCAGSSLSTKMVATTRFVNNTAIPFVLKEGNAGVYRDICTLQAKPPNNEHSISMDPNATYREYVVATGIKGETVLVTSDDCADNSTITIVKDEKDEKKYRFIGLPRHLTTGNPQAPATSLSSRERKERKPSKLADFFRRISSVGRHKT